MNEDTKVLLDEIENRLEPKFDSLRDSLQSQITENRERIEQNSEAISQVQLVLENEIRPAINLLAEGHIIINRKLDLLLSREEENDLTKLHVSALETRVDKLEEEVFGLTS